MTLIGRAQVPPIAPIDMVGLPECAQRDRYDVRATSPLSRSATMDERAAMLRVMLAERFKLAAQVEKREQPAFDLILARSDGRLGSGSSRRQSIALRKPRLTARRPKQRWRRERRRPAPHFPT
jgi:uncharacterized protein (TIGR03435 family)